MKHFMPLAAALIAFFALSLPSHAADLKIYYMDSQRILTDSLAGKDAYKQLEVLKDERQQEIDRMQANLKKMTDEMAAKGLTMNESARLDLQNNYDSELKKYNRFVKDAQEELRKKELALIKPISDEVSAIIDEYGDQHNIDIILDRRDPGIIYTSKKLDITDAILELYNKKYQETAGKKK